MQDKQAEGNLKMMDRLMTQIVVTVSQVYTDLHTHQTAQLYSFLYVNKKEKKKQTKKQSRSVREMWQKGKQQGGDAETQMLDV